MIRELLRPRKHKIAIAASVALVAVLTALGIWTNNTAQRTDRIEHTIEVQHVQTVQALCERPYTAACLHHAINVIETCRHDPRCTALLGQPLMTGPDISRQQAEREFRVENPISSETPNSSQGITKPASQGPPESGAPPGGKSPLEHETKPPPESETPPPDEEDHEAAPEPAPEPIVISPPPAPASPSGLVPSATKSVEEVLGCIPRLEIACAVQGVLGPR